jgi:hypothetical protein
MLLFVLPRLRIVEFVEIPVATLRRRWSVVALAYLDYLTYLMSRTQEFTTPTRDSFH